MSNSSILLNTLHKFTPNGQLMLLNQIKTNRKLLDKPFGFIDFAKTITDKNTIPDLNCSNESVINIVKNILNNYLDKIDLSANDKNKLNASFNILKLDSYKVNNRDKAVFTISKKFNQSKENIINILKKFNIKSIIEKINNWDNPEDIHEILEEFNITNLSKEFYVENSLYFQFYKLYLNIKKRLGINSHMTLNFKGKNWKWDLYIEIQKAMLPKSNDKRVRRIEKILLQKYNLDYANLYDYNNAINTLNAVQIAVKNNIKLPRSIIISPYRKNLERGVNFGDENTILYNPNDYFVNNEIAIKSSNFNEKEKEYLLAYNKLFSFLYFSTIHSEHEMLHEIIHNEKNTCNIDAKVTSMYKDVINHLSLYSQYSYNNNDNEEIRAELRTKQLLDGLNEEEEELLNILIKK